jgi:hypothetical protein
MKKEELILKIKEFEEKLKLEKEEKKKQQEQKNKELEAKDKIIISLGSTNKKLLSELEELKKEVDDKLDKIGMKQISEKERDMQRKKKELPYEQVLKVKEKELKNTMNLLEILKKDKESLQKNLEEKVDSKKTRALEDKLKEEEFRNNQLEIEIKLSKNLRDEHNKCEQIHENFEKERKNFQGEIKFYKDKNKDLMQKVKEEEEKQNKMHNYLANINSQKIENFQKSNNINSNNNNKNNKNNNNYEENNNENNNSSSNNLNLPNINKYSSKRFSNNNNNINNNLARSKEINLEKYWKLLDTADKVPQNNTDGRLSEGRSPNPERNEALYGKSKKSISKLEQPKKNNFADRQKFSNSLSHKTFKLSDSEENTAKLFGMEEKEILLKILPSNEVEKLEKKFEMMQKNKIALEKKLQLDTKLLTKKASELDERLEYTNLHNKELEHRNKILGYQINEHKNENKIVSRKLNEMNLNASNSKILLRQKEEENRMLVLKVQEMQKSFNEMGNGEKSSVNNIVINDDRDNRNRGIKNSPYSETEENSNRYGNNEENNLENENLENEDGEENEINEDAGNEEDN